MTGNRTRQQLAQCPVPPSNLVQGVSDLGWGPIRRHRPSAHHAWPSTGSCADHPDLRAAQVMPSRFGRHAERRLFARNCCSTRGRPTAVWPGLGSHDYSWAPGTGDALLCRQSGVGWSPPTRSSPKRSAGKQCSTPHAAHLSW